MKLLSCPLLALAMTAALMSPPGSAHAQSDEVPPNLTGKVTGVEKKGRATTLKVADDGGTEHTFALTPKVELEIVSTGDDAFLAAGQFVRIDAVQSNDTLFGSTFSVYPQYSGRPTPAKAVKAPPVPGRSQNLHFVTGEIVRLDDKGDGKYHLLQLKLTPKSQLTIYVEPSHRIRVVQTDPTAIEEGQTVNIYGRQTGNRITPSRITIQTGEELKGAEYLPTVEKKP